MRIDAPQKNSTFQFIDGVEMRQESDVNRFYYHFLEFVIKSWFLCFWLSEVIRYSLFYTAEPQSNAVDNETSVILLTCLI